MGQRQELYLLAVEDYRDLTKIEDLKVYGQVSRDSFS
jgi:hypothetical protein